LGFAPIGFCSVGIGLGAVEDFTGIGLDIGAFGTGFGVPAALDSDFSAELGVAGANSCFTGMGSFETISMSKATDCGNEELVIPASMNMAG
jgi:hypothetical protein